MLTLIPSILVFGAATMGVPQAMGYYGISSSDVQFGMLVFYATMVSFGPVAQHFFARIPAKTYLWISVIGELGTLYGCYYVRNLEVMLVIRVISAVFNAGINNVCLDLLFRKLKSEYTREIGYASFYTLILCVGGLCSFFGSFEYDEQSMNHFYKFVMFGLLPGTFLLTIILNNVRLIPFKLMRISRMGWVDCFLLGTSMGAAGYFLVYGQEYNWLDDVRIRWAIAVFMSLGLCAFLRLRYRQEPFLNLAVFRSPNFRLGLLLLVILYFIRGAFNITSGYISSILEVPYRQSAKLMLLNAGGSVLGSIVSTIMVIRKVHMRIIWLLGFLILLIFYGTMSFRFNINASVYDYELLLVLQGLGQGMLMNPIIVFYLSAVPQEIANSATGFGIMTRFLSFSGSIALIDNLQLRFSRLHQELINNDLNAANTQYTDYLRNTSAMLKSRGVLPDKAGGMAFALMKKIMGKEAYVEFAMNYYQWICVLILLAIFIIMCVPAINRTIINLQEKRPWGAGF